MNSSKFVQMYRPPKLKSSSFGIWTCWLTVVVEGFLVGVTLGDHHWHDDVLETWYVKHTGVFEVWQIGCSDLSRIERNIPKNEGDK